MIEELLGWKEWRTRCLSYMLNKRTIKIQSGANLIFAAPKEQWMKVFEHLIVSSEENFLEVMVCNSKKYHLFLAFATQLYCARIVLLLVQCFTHPNDMVLGGHFVLKNPKYQAK